MKTESKYLNFYQKSSFLLRFLQFSQKISVFLQSKLQIFVLSRMVTSHQKNLLSNHNFS